HGPLDLGTQVVHIEGFSTGPDTCCSRHQQSPFMSSCKLDGPTESTAVCQCWILQWRRNRLYLSASGFWLDGKQPRSQCSPERSARTDACAGRYETFANTPALEELASRTAESGVPRENAVIDLPGSDDLAETHPDFPQANFH